jgi:tetratricopeptide (TPR) repeat protein
MAAELALLQSGKSVKQRRTGERRWGVVKRISIAAALLALTAAALTTLVREISPDTPNASNRRSKNQLANKEYDEGVRCSSRDNKEGLEKALEHFNRAIGFDPKFTMAYNGLFEVYLGGYQLGLSPAEMSTKVRAYASKLMELEPKLAEAQAAQALIEWSDWKWNKAESLCDRAQHELCDRAHALRVLSCLCGPAG